MLNQFGATGVPMTSNDQVVVVAVTAVGWNKCDFEQTTSKIIRAFFIREQVRNFDQVGLFLTNLTNF
jgi:hypothetical protein